MASETDLHPRWTASEASGLFLISAASLAFEIILTRLYSVAQFYHFAFMVVSIALLGFGASGTFLAIFPFIGLKSSRNFLGWLSLAVSVSILGSYLLFNNLPFDSYQIAWDRRQAFILVIHYIALALPFFFSGMAIGMLLSVYPSAAGSTYATNLFGSAFGCALALISPIFFEGVGTVLLCSMIAAAAAIICMVTKTTLSSAHRTAIALSVLLMVFISLNLLQRSLTGRYLNWLELKISPYKNLSYALQIPGAKLLSSRWNSFSRVDLITSPSIRSLPGLSYRFLEPLPSEDGLLVDGDDLSPVIRSFNDPGFASYLPAAIAFELRPNANTLILEPRGGLDILTALLLGADGITAVESNPLIVQASAHLYQNPLVKTVIESDRSYCRASSELYDVVIHSLTSSFHPVRSGAYSLVEDYHSTIEAYQGFLDRLRPNGLLVITRWLQTPPSESLRSFALAVTALEESGLDPAAHLVAFRSFNTTTILVSRSAFLPGELQSIRQFTSERAFDMIIAPDINPDETNRYNVLPESVYYQNFKALLAAQPRDSFYRHYSLDVSPPADNRPFFGHYFKWSQAGQVFSELGKTWQPFGGAGYFVILALLALAALSAGILILLPVIITPKQTITNYPGRRSAIGTPYLFYFGMIGLAFMLIEIPLIQHFILFIGEPAYSLATVLFSLLLFSGIGSQLSPKIHLKLALGILVFILLLLPILLPAIFETALGLSFVFRLAITCLLILPIGVLMGVPFSGGILWMGKMSANYGLIPWAWAVNGAASVVASILAALLVITLGFVSVLLIGALCYFGAFVIVILKEHHPPVQLPHLETGQN